MGITGRHTWCKLRSEIPICELMSSENGVSTSLVYSLLCSGSSSQVGPCQRVLAAYLTGVYDRQC